MRWLAAACLVLAAVVGTAQAVHIHGDWLPKADHTLHAPAASSQALGGDERCPLCVAMHSVLPASSVQYTALEVLEPAAVAEGFERTGESSWHFARFSRPPPASLL